MKKKLSDQLKAMNACSEAVEWVGRKSLKTAWAECERGDWMLWLAGRIIDDQRLYVTIACEIAESVLHLVPVSEKRPAAAIQAARGWLAGTVAESECRKAARAAANAAAYAAYASANAADAAAAYAAAYAAAAAAYAAAAAAAYADSADSAYAAANAAIVRKHIPYEAISKALINHQK